MSRILITGTSKGLGRATAIELARRGHEIIATARKPETLADVPAVARLELDVTDEASVRRAVAEAGRIDVLVNNAAEIALAPVESFPFDEIRRLYEINFFGMLRMIQAVVPQMRERRSGTVVNVSSIAGRLARPLNGIYSSTKWAMEGVSESLRAEVGHFGVRVLLIEPGMIGTGALDAPRVYYGEKDPYLPLVEATKFPSREAMTPTEAIAQVVADSIESPERQFRWPAGADANALLAMRAKLDDDGLEAALRARWNLDW